jgi:endonuclease/exonuclease/phosphatase (EEP) superfamily protein YafD
MILVTWNVLHRIHALNWGEEVPERFPDEAARISRITRRVEALLSSGSDVIVCMQEVSGDQLESLEGALRSFAVCSFTYPRVPSLRVSGVQPLRRPTEHLVTIGARAQVRTAEAFRTDRGKGFLCVDADGLLVVNTHVSFAEKRPAQIDRIAAVVGDERCVICGDFNAPSKQVLAGLDRGFALVDLGPDALPTRPRNGNGRGKPPAIDHILVRGVAGSEGAVVDVAGESDHNLVRAKIG